MEQSFGEPGSFCFFSLAQKHLQCSPGSDTKRSSPYPVHPSHHGVHTIPDHGACSFLLSLQAQYRHGLVLCQEAAEVQDAAFPEAELFQAAAALFQTKLTSFHRQVERRQVERELLRDLGCFSSKVGARALLRWEPAPWCSPGMAALPFCSRSRG